MVRTVDHTERKNRVLAEAVTSYIATGEPVSSQELALKFNLSSATLRNILAELEEEGYLMSLHTSSGRVPTDKGYRYYVDFLMGAQTLAPQQQQAIEEFYRGNKLSLEEVLDKTSDIVANLTHYTAVVSFSEWEDKIFYHGLSNIFAHPEFHNVEKLAILVQLLEEKKKLLELLRQHAQDVCKVYIGEEIACPGISDVCSLVVSPYRAGSIAVLGPRRMCYGLTVSTLEYISEILDSILEDL
ncbi:MAG: HTH domain-containing protein [Candidatus Omnitrophica bacterium]|nr:HTH domain-containing protein [Candidatus Omnitrophota bacterium]